MREVSPAGREGPVEQRWPRQTTAKRRPGSVEWQSCKHVCRRSGHCKLLKNCESNHPSILLHALIELLSPKNTLCLFHFTSWLTFILYCPTPLHVFWALSLSIGICACLDPFCLHLLKSFSLLQPDVYSGFRFTHLITRENKFLTSTFRSRVVTVWCSGVKTTCTFFFFALQLCVWPHKLGLVSKMVVLHS